MKNLNRAIVALTTVMGAIMLGVSAAGATVVTYDPTDPTAGATEGTLTAIQGWVANHGAPLVAGLVFIGVAFILLLKFLRRGTRAA